MNILRSPRSRATASIWFLVLVSVAFSLGFSLLVRAAP
jgi:hypothetical protein